MPSKPGQRKRRPMEWNENQKKTLAAVFEGRKSRQKIAEDCGLHIRTIEDWITHPEFQAKLAEMREQMLEAFDELGVAYVRKEQRIMALAQMAESARQEYEQRPWLKEFRPVLVKRPKVDADGNTDPDGRLQTVEDYIITEHFNTDAYNAWRQTMADLAAEQGARKNVTELTGKNGEALPGLVINLPPINEQTQAKYMRRGTATASEDAPEGGESDGSAGPGLS